jgi:hypothetical protein
MKKAILFICVVTLLTGCELSAHEDEPPEEETTLELLPRVPCPDDFRGGIIFGGCIEGIEIGDDSTTVAQKLGPPGSMGWEDGVQFFHYQEDWIIVGLYDTLGVVSVLVTGQYAGETQEGVALDMAREEVLTRLGSPITTDEDAVSIHDKYGFEGPVTFSLTYAVLTQTLRSISMSFTTPRIPSDT